MNRARRRLTLGLAVSLGALAVVCAVVSPASAHGERTLAIGDSVMLGARSDLQKLGVQKVDARVSRQADAAAAVLSERGSALPMRVVIHLGTNGPFTAENCRSIMKVVGAVRKVFLVNVKVPRRWEEPNNREIDMCAGIHADQVTVVDWHRAASRHPDWLYSDGVHLRPAGALGYARLIAKAIGADVTQPTFVTT